MGVRRSLTAFFVSGLVKMFRVSTIKIILVFVARLLQSKGEKCSGHVSAAIVCEVQMPDRRIYFEDVRCSFQ